MVTSRRQFLRLGTLAGLSTGLVAVHPLPGSAKANVRQPAAAGSGADELHLRVGAYNVAFLSEASAAEIGKMLKSFELDIVGLTEVPRAPATRELADAMGVMHFVVGTISSGTSEDKLKAILSRTPLGPMSEIDCSPVKGGFVTGGESVTHAETVVQGVRISIYSPHISDGIVEPMQKLLGDPGFQADQADVILVMGDFNANLGTPQMELIHDQGFHSSWSDLKLDVRKTKTYDFLTATRDEGVIDHIMIKGKGVKAVDGGIVPAMTEKGMPMSDHAMIWAELVIPLSDKK